MSDGAWRVLVLLLTVSVLIEGLILVGVLRELGVVLLQIGPPRHGDVGGGPIRGMQVDLAFLQAGHPGLIVFLGPSCGFCKSVAPTLPILRRKYPEIQVVAVVVGDEPEAKEKYALDLGLEVRTDQDHLMADWAIPGTPFAVAVSSDHRVLTSGVVNNLPQLESLADAVLLPEDSETVENGSTLPSLPLDAKTGAVLDGSDELLRTVTGGKDGSGH